ncbi:prolyl oligopeptidase family serine peptidase [Leeuwenhoekiella parthenopeia]|uniref:prolyl oligopeptidase n=1 Tax=Leeuwenhoekiella parthenopeia TaxID=2890320 RepID=A0ABS8GND5_9FLAO|nr:prolyl oligopeptidase family serine peptidase [Leeuwenhoekiella parthenopeia]MCC4211286.1 prolyl oligopeptidase family serine peptidase [Leeuwenhoekiella parthenopeia]
MKYLWILTFLYFPLHSYSQKRVQSKLQYPAIHAKDVQETYFGIEVTDPYRHLEQLEQEEIKGWYEAQAKLADTVLNNITGRNLLLDKFTDYGSRAAAHVSDVKVSESGRYFYLKRNAEEQYASLYYRDFYEAEEKLLFDPKTYDYDTKHTISYFKPSWKGNKLAIALTHSGYEISDIIILDLEKNDRYPEVLHNAWPDSFLGISWLPDDTGFLFLQFSYDEEGAEHTETVLHRLGKPADSLISIFGSKLINDLTITEDVYPIATIDSQDAIYALGYLATVDNFWDAYITPIADLERGTPNWEPFYTKEDQVYTSEGQFYRDNYYYRTNKLKNTNTINKVPILNPDFKNSKQYADSESNEILNSFLVTENGVCYTTTKYGTQASLYTSDGYKSDSIALPYKPGAIKLYQTQAGSSHLWFNLSGWTSESDRYYLNLKTQKFTDQPLTTPVNFDEFNDIINNELLVEADDGEQIPVSLIYNKNLTRDGTHPALFYTYGAYGTTISPFFSPIFLSWVELGGILCIPHVRGGGEKGEEWHLQGMKLNKCNSWKDLIAVTEYLIDKGFTAPDKTVIYSSSAGGITIGGALNEKPELFAAAIAEVSVMNPFRSENRDDGGGSNQDEYGSISDSLGVVGLTRMDPYLNIRNTNYPAVLLTAGDNDARVPLWMPGKYVARLQNSTTSNDPVLFRIHKESGHQGSSEISQMYLEYVDVFSFGLWQTGHPLFQNHE